MNGCNVTFFDSFKSEHISKEIKKIIGNKNVVTYIYRIQANDSINCGYFLDLVILRLTVKFCYIILVYFLMMHMKRMITVY